MAIPCLDGSAAVEWLNGKRADQGGALDSGRFIGAAIISYKDCAAVMSQPDNEAPPAYTEHDVDVTAGQTEAYPSAKNLRSKLSHVTKTPKGIKINGSPSEKHQSPGGPNVSKTLKGIKIDSSPYEKAPTPGPPGTKDDLFNAISKG
ncbi:hypothetical protein V494_03684 [Pseudogymnoascus sp. VKM F-4513 (FW-928)]|nr:hypothetical protein V494_03684 [Pseudogymnoascus sp. VKM F-4513 (FW-928)]